MDQKTTRWIRPVSRQRRGSQRGVEAIEFGLWALLMMPPFLWMFISGINFVRYNKASDVTRSAAMMYIKNTTMTALSTQRVLQRIANGLDLQVESGGAVSNTLGSGLVILTKVQFVDGTCNCTNANQYVITQRLYIGNRNLQIDGAGVDSFAGGVPAGNIWNASTGLVANYLTDSNARASSAFTSLWGTSLANGQIVYLVESYFRTTTFGSGDYDSGGIYNRVFM